jgi:hypothetical protein
MGCAKQRDRLSGTGLLRRQAEAPPQSTDFLKGSVMSNANNAAPLDSASLDAWKKAAAKSAPGGMSKH